MIQRPTEPTAIKRPPSIPRSKPTSATQGASATTPSLLDHEKAIINPHVAARPAIAMNVKRYRRRAANNTAAISLLPELDGKGDAQRSGDLSRGRRLHQIRNARRRH